MEHGGGLRTLFEEFMTRETSDVGSDIVELGNIIVFTRASLAADKSEYSCSISSSGLNATLLNRVDRRTNAMSL